MFSSYEHLPADRPKVYNRRLGIRRVATAPKNMRVNPIKKGDAQTTPGLTIGSQPVYMQEPFELGKKLLRLKEKKNRPTTPFRPPSRSTGFFSDDKSLYGSGTVVHKRRELQKPYDGYEHDNPYVPYSGGNHGQPFGEYEHMPSSAAEKVVKHPYVPPRERRLQKRPWRHTHSYQAGVSPSISAHSINLRSEFVCLRRKS